MRPFNQLSRLEEVRLERLSRARSKYLSRALRAQRAMLEARLERRRLDVILSRPGFAVASEEVRGLVSYSTSGAGPCSWRWRPGASREGTRPGRRLRS